MIGQKGFKLNLLLYILFYYMLCYVFLYTYLDDPQLYEFTLHLFWLHFLQVK